jgi:hypothetical protein
MFQFKLIIQCRVDPQKLQRVNDGGYWLVPDGSAIRWMSFFLIVDYFAFLK